MLKSKIAITSLATLSPLGDNPFSVWNEYASPKSCIAVKTFMDKDYFVATLSEENREKVSSLRKEDLKYKALDETVLMAILTARQAIQRAGWQTGDDFGINIGSSRGATQLFEKYHEEYLDTGATPTLTSPTTTLGNISSWVAHDLKSQGPEISHSITCSTALHAILNGVAWLQAGMATKFLVGGSEAPLTGFTLAQMAALKIYAKDIQEYPCRALDLTKTKNTMVLGEAAGMACLEIGEQPNALGYIIGLGYGTDELEHNISISEEANCFQKSMLMALQGTPIGEVDAIVMHAPGTVKGDVSEYKAIQKIFGEQLPFLTTNKWKTGHTFGASGLLNLELALLMMEHQTVVGVPFAIPQRSRNSLQKVLINAVGFGGNAVSILLARA